MSSYKEKTQAEILAIIEYRSSLLNDFVVQFVNDSNTEYSSLDKRHKINCLERAVGLEEIIDELNDLKHRILNDE